VGVALLAAQAYGLNCNAIPAYTLGGDYCDILDSTLRAMNCSQVKEPQPADLVVFALAIDHRHLAIMTEKGIIHAHAGLGRVVEGPIPNWPVVAFWSFQNF
jgi:hypothetical protein